MCPALRPETSCIRLRGAGHADLSSAADSLHARSGSPHVMKLRREKRTGSIAPHGARGSAAGRASRPASSRQFEASIPPCRRVCGRGRHRYAGWAIASHPTAQNRLVNKFGPYVAWTLEGLSSAIAGMGGFAATDATKPAKPAAKRGELVVSTTILACGKFARRAQLADSRESRKSARSRAAGALETL